MNTKLRPKKSRSTLPSSNKYGLADSVYDELKVRLFDSRYGASGWLPVDELAAELGVSRQPVMDSMKRLAMEGFVTIAPQVGCRVREYTAEEIHDFFRLFALGEALVAELAAARASAEDILKLQVMSGQIGQLGTLPLNKQDLARTYRSLNRMFHAEIRRIARSAPVTDVVEGLGDRSDFFIATSGRSMFAETLNVAHQEHAALVEALARHDEAAAHEAMKTHVLNTGKRLEKFLRDRRQHRVSGPSEIAPDEAPQSKSARPKIRAKTLRA